MTMPFFFGYAVLLMTAAAAERGSCGLQCCPRKKVDTELYTFAYEDEAAYDQGCQDTCVYTRDRDGEKFCFQPGQLAVQCIKCKKLQGILKRKILFF